MKTIKLSADIKNPKRLNISYRNLTDEKDNELMIFNEMVIKNMDYDLYLFLKELTGLMVK